MRGMLHLRSALLLATWLLIDQSEGKIKPHREDRLSGPQVGAKTCPLERGIKKLLLDFCQSSPKTCLVKRSCGKYCISS